MDSLLDREGVGEAEGEGEGEGEAEAEVVEEAPQRVQEREQRLGREKLLEDFGGTEMAKELTEQPA